MYIRTLLPMISSSFVRLSRGSFSTSPFLFLFLLFSPLWVPLALILSGGVTLSFNWSGHKWRWPILQLLVFHPLLQLYLLPLLPLLQLVVWPSRPSWSSFNGRRLTLVVVMTISLSDVSDEQLSRQHCPPTGSHNWSCPFSLSFSRGFAWWWAWWWWGWCWLFRWWRDDDLLVPCLLSFVTKRGSRFRFLRVVLLYFGGELV